MVMCIFVSVSTNKVFRLAVPSSLRSSSLLLVFQLNYFHQEKDTRYCLWIMACLKLYYIVKIMLEDGVWEGVFTKKYKNHDSASIF